jgi:hypothetical protein
MSQKGAQIWLDFLSERSVCGGAQSRFVMNQRTQYAGPTEKPPTCGIECNSLVPNARTSNRPALDGEQIALAASRPCATAILIDRFFK